MSDISTRNIKPDSASTTEYSGAYTYGKKFGEFKYGGAKYGAPTMTSIGQMIPGINTKEI